MYTADLSLDTWCEEVVSEHIPGLDINVGLSWLTQ